MFNKWIFPNTLTAWIGALRSVLHQRSAWRLEVLMTGIGFAKGRKTVTSWFRAAGITQPYKAFYYFIGALGRKTEAVATILFEMMITILFPKAQRVLMALDDSPTKRYGPKVEGAGRHRNPTPGPADARYVYGHVWVVLSLVFRHRWWGAIGLPLLAKLYVRARDIAGIPAHYRIGFQTKLQQGAELVQWASRCCRRMGKTLWIVTDGGYTKRGFLLPVIEAGVTLVTRLRKDAALRTVPASPRKGQRGRPRKYGKTRIDLRHKAAKKTGWTRITTILYGEETTKSVKMFLATYRPVGGKVLVLIVRETDGSWRPFLCSDLKATAEEILEAVADRFAIEQNFHDLKEVGGMGQQQLRNIWANIGATHLNLWSHTLIEMWAWNRSASVLCDRSRSPWDDPNRRPSHADRRAALRREIIRQTFFETFSHDRKSRKFQRQFDHLLNLAI